MTRKCPGPGCKKRIEPHMLACPPHWYQVPAPLRRAVFEAWDDGAGTGSRAHRAAIRRAITYMEPLETTLV